MFPHSGTTLKMQEDIIMERITEIQSEIAGFKQLLDGTDYQALKHADGVMTDEEYEPIRLERQRLRDEINALEKEQKEIEINSKSMANQTI